MRLHALHRSDGSSPLARGTLRIRLDTAQNRRFIPARAGNTPAQTGAQAGTPVHPRSRGEHPIVARFPYDGGGSSPLARGTPAEADLGREARRFIPARAGNTSTSPTPRSPAPVHPRSRGEHPLAAGRGGGGDGSSPLARGTLDVAARHTGVDRFIPARAGNTSRPSVAGTITTVHPRSRGEHTIPAARRTTFTGSSPLARGTLPGR